MSTNIVDTVTHLLNALPEGAEFRFYWENGIRYMSSKFPNQDVQIIRSSPATDNTNSAIEHEHIN